MMDDTIYNDSNRAFLQAFLARGAMTYEEAQPILAAIFSIQGGYIYFSYTICLHCVRFEVD